jgi:hypothetical protein
LLFVKRQLRKKLYAISNFAYRWPFLTNFLSNLPEAPFFTEVAPISHQLVINNKVKVVKKIYRTRKLRKITSHVNVQQDSLHSIGMPQIIYSNRSSYNTISTETSFQTIYTETSEDASLKKEQKKLTTDKYQNVQDIRHNKENSEFMFYGKNVKTEKGVDDLNDIRLSEVPGIINFHEHVFNSEVQILCKDEPKAENGKISKNYFPETCQPLPIMINFIDSLSDA